MRSARTAAAIIYREQDQRGRAEESSVQVFRQAVGAVRAVSTQVRSCAAALGATVAQGDWHNTTPMAAEFGSREEAATGLWRQREAGGLLGAMLTR